MRALIFTLVAAMSGCGCVSMQTAYERTQPSMVLLEWTEGQCTGVAVGPHTILTAAHCTRHTQSHSVNIDGKATDYTVIADDGSDHVLVRVKAEQAHFTRLTRAAGFRVGDAVFVWGHPHGLPSVMREGRIAGFTSKQDFCFEAGPCHVVFLDANLTHGDSGAPIFNEAGSLVGLESGGAERGPWTQCFFFTFQFTAKQMADIA